MKKQHILYIFMAAVVLWVSCAKDAGLELPSVDQDDVPEGMVRVRIQPRLASADVVETRSVTPSNADILFSGNIRVLVFDGDTSNTANPTLMQKPAEGVMVNNQLTAILYQQSSPCNLCVVANISSIDAAYLDGLTAGTDLREISSRLKMTVPSSTPIRLKSPFPMSGWSATLDKIEKTFDPSLLSPPVLFSRSVARIDITDLGANFKILGAQMVNAPRTGYVLPQTLLPTWGITEEISYNQIRLSSAGPMLTDSLFCFESKGTLDGNNDKATRIVIEGIPAGSASSSFYPIDLIYTDPLSSTGSRTSDIRRNYCYNIALKAVKKDGYRTYDEAARSTALNNQVEMDIVVSDPFAHDITTNGTQFLGTTNSEFVLYPLDANTVQSVHISTLTYTCDPGWAAGTITLPAGVSWGGGLNGRMDIRNAVSIKDIVVNISSGFTSGIIVAHIGNLRKEIYVRRMPPTSPTGNVYSNYFDVVNNESTDFKVGEIISPSAATSWLKLSTSSDIDAGGSSLNDKITHPEGGIFIHVAPNAGFETSAMPREASLYISGKKDNQRIKVLVQQAAFDVYYGKRQINPYSYVGTFHRWNEMGERLIRIKAPVDSLGGKNSTENDIWWQADVIAGQEFIVLDTLVSKDAGITIFKNDSVNWNGLGDRPTLRNSVEVESSPGTQLESKLRSVRGRGSNIYFRVGLTGRLDSPDAQPRYGLITISYGNVGSSTVYGKHNIYVRQGEAADYLMRPWDPSTRPQGTPLRPNPTYDYKSASRPLARKFTVYHLTDPNGGGGSIPWVIDNGKNGYRFVDHPSQGGYFFFRSGTKAIYPHASSSVGAQNLPAFQLPNNLWNSNWETCPKGYRRPGDGPGRTYADRWIGYPTDPYWDGNSNASPLYPDDIKNSELRQSLWLFPLHGGFRSDFSNQLRGYLADGYFDRREIYPTGILIDKSYRYGVVKESANDIYSAYWGYLVFNPINYASIFLPLNGYYNSAIQNRVTNIGKDGNINTTTAGSGPADGWILASGYFDAFTPGWAFDMYSVTGSSDGYSVRCIKDEQPIINTEGDSGDNTSLDDVVKGDSLLAIRHLYTHTATTLREQIEAEYRDRVSRINSIAISGNKTLTDDDYAYLNTWADGLLYPDSNLRHLIIRGSGNPTIPSGAFTSPQWSHIILIDAVTLNPGAFAAGLKTSAGDGSLNNLTLGALDPISISPSTFGFHTPNVQLHLDASGDEYSTAVGNSWKGSNWKAIRTW